MTQVVVGRVRAAVQRTIPPGKRVLVISKGDDELIQFDNRPAYHFPADNHGDFAGYYPGTGEEAITKLRDASRQTSAEYLVIPAAAHWWLDYYEELERFLSNHSDCIWQDQECTIFLLKQLTIAPALTPDHILGIDISADTLALANHSASEMMDAGELAYLAAAAALVPWDDGAIAVEIGAFHGQTTVFLARVFEQLGLRVPILSIDPFERVQANEFNPQGSYAKYLHAIQQAGLEKVCMPLVGFSQDAAPLVPDRIGLLIVDGWHEHAAVRQDLELYGAKLIRGGMMFLDDYGVLYPGVVQAADEFFDESSRFTVLHRDHFIVARARGPAARRRSHVRSRTSSSKMQSA